VSGQAAPTERLPVPLIAFYITHFFHQFAHLFLECRQGLRRAGSPSKRLPGPYNTPDPGPYGDPSLFNSSSSNVHHHHTINQGIGSSSSSGLASPSGRLPSCPHTHNNASAMHSSGAASQQHHQHLRASSAPGHQRSEAAAEGNAQLDSPCVVSAVCVVCVCTC